MAAAAVATAMAITPGCSTDGQATARVLEGPAQDRPGAAMPSRDASDPGITRAGATAEPGAGSIAQVDAASLAARGDTIAAITVVDHDVATFTSPMFPEDTYEICRATVDEVLAGELQPSSVLVVCAVDATQPGQHPGIPESLAAVGGTATVAISAPFDQASTGLDEPVHALTAVRLTGADAATRTEPEGMSAPTDPTTAVEVDLDAYRAMLTTG
jgi:hypothetical protein